MSALRARALMGEACPPPKDSICTRKALVLSQQGARDWEAIRPRPEQPDRLEQPVRSPGRGVLGLGLGDVTEPGNNGAQDSRWSTVRNPRWTTLSLAAGYLAMIEADWATQAAEATMRPTAGYRHGGARTTPEFFRRASAGVPGLLRVSDDRIRLWCLWASFCGRDYETLRKEARASVRRLGRSKCQSPTRAEEKPFAEVAYRTVAELRPGW